jgi:VWFA-related protein
MKTRPSLYLALSVAALSLLAMASRGLVTAAQQPSAQRPALADKTKAHEVTLPVMVVDKKGALVTNLTAGDFTLTQDGRPQVIQSVTTQSKLPFRLGLLVDTSRGVHPAIDAERKAAEKFLEVMLPADPNAGGASDKSTPPGPEKTSAHGNEAFLIHFDREVELLEDFTASRDKLDHELEQMTSTSQERKSEGPESSGDDRGSGEPRSSRYGGTQLYDAIYLASDELMKPKNGRKALIVFSDGADSGSKETLNDAIDAADHAGVEVFTIYIKGEEEREGFGNPGGHHGGIGGGGYPGGGGWPGSGGGGHQHPPQSAAGVDGRKIMQQIASRTGGLYFEAKKKDNLEDIYGLVANALRQQYLLTYTPDQADTEGDFHKTVVKTDKTDMTVITCEGYYGRSSGGDREGGDQ